MLSKIGSRLIAVSITALAASGAFTQGVAAQDLRACGQDTYIGVEAECTLEPPAQCAVMCTPLTVEAACAADLSVSCRGGCQAELEANCSGSCEGQCEADCRATPGQFQCAADCRAQCDADCSAKCQSDGRTHCEASCRASCSGSCDASCNATLPSADCQAKCSASCSGSCRARAAAECQVDCQAQGFAACQTRLEGGCKAQCMTNPNGGLYCDGQFVKSRNIDECVAALRGLLDVEVEAYAEGSAACANGECNAGGEAGVSCAATSRPTRQGEALLVLCAVFGTTLYVRRRRLR